MDESTVSHRSVSQANEYAACPYRYKLRRIDGVFEIPSVWAPQGTGVHTAAESYEKSGRTLSVEQTQEVFKRSYAEAINRQCEHVPNFNYWFRSGPYDPETDIERRFRLGLEQTKRYVEYYRDQAPEEVIWMTPDGQPSIELGFSIELGEVPVRGFIDQVITDGSSPTPRVRDIKTGKNPGDDFQLAVYGEALRQLYGVQPETGDYWMGQRGKPTVPYKLSQWPPERLAHVFAEMDSGIRRGDFPAYPESSKCARCPVQASCSFFVR